MPIWSPSHSTISSPDCPVSAAPPAPRSSAEDKHHRQLRVSECTYTITAIHTTTLYKHKTGSRCSPPCDKTRADKQP